MPKQLRKENKSSWATQYRFGGPEHAKTVHVAEDFVFSSMGRLNELCHQQAVNSRKLTKLHPEMFQPIEAVRTPGDAAKRQGKGTSSPLLGNKSSVRQVADRSTSQEMLSEFGNWDPADTLDYRRRYYTDYQDSLCKGQKYHSGWKRLEATIK